MQIEQLTAEHLGQLHALTKGFSWPHTPADLSFALETGTGWAGMIGEDLAGSCFSWRLGSNVATLGLLVVAPHLQGRGFGRKLFRHTMKGLGTRTVLLHATEDGAPLYRSEGFSADGQIRQLQGIVAERPMNEAPASLIQPSADRDLCDKLIDLDELAIGYNRSAILVPLLPAAQIACSGDPGAPDGFALSRPFGRGHVIGPVAATDPLMARTLIESLLSRHFGAFARIDVTAGLTETDWLNEWGLVEADKVQAMSNAPLPSGSAEVHRYALIGHAFG